MYGVMKELVIPTHYQKAPASVSWERDECKKEKLLPKLVRAITLWMNASETDV